MGLPHWQGEVRSQSFKVWHAKQHARSTPTVSCSNRPGATNVCLDQFHSGQHVCATATACNDQCSSQPAIAKWDQAPSRSCSCTHDLLPLRGRVSPSAKASDGR
ncbi:hypothetical protein HaLaN_27787 [Haematococcus lacustris]|uniref:Uncharacterized protein n=1 Tax=Haematococcus lacustris TaxID=44745 RepID=A0A6A0ABA0_HAELA|nr:hypothetical protein HaLaN_27787 [Haematococcus lacustris]